MPDPRDPRAVPDPRDPRAVPGPRDPRAMPDPRDPRAMPDPRDPRDPRAVPGPRDPRDTLPPPMPPPPADEDDGYRSSDEQSPPASARARARARASRGSSRGASASRGSRGSSSVLLGPRPRAQRQRFASLTEEASDGETVERQCVEESSSLSLASLAILPLDKSLSSRSLDDVVAAGSDTQTNADDHPSTDGHPLPMCNSDSFSAAPSRERSGVRRAASSGVEVRRKKRAGNSHMSTVSGLLDAVGGSGATTTLGHTTPAPFGHSASRSSSRYASNTRSRHASNTKRRHVNHTNSRHTYSASFTHSSLDVECVTAATPLPLTSSSVGGHHMVIQQNGVFMKESCSRREERFYHMLERVRDFADRNPDLVSSLGDPDEQSETALNGLRNKYEKKLTLGPPADPISGGFAAELWRHIVLMRLLPFVPHFRGIRRVCFTSAVDGDTGAKTKNEPGIEPDDSRSVNPCLASDAVVLLSDAPNPGADAEHVRQFIVLDDICSGFAHPCILDIKMGSRQYGMNPSEKKLRSKENKSAMTTSMRYGVRLAGMKRWCGDRQQYETKSKIAGRFLTLEELSDTIDRFAQRSEWLRRAFYKQVRTLRQIFERQGVFRFFTSSLLFVYDADAPLHSARVVMVDFAFTYDQEELRRGGDPDAEKEFDDGYIKALDTLLALFA